jgi:hypothetical protein
MSKKHKTYKSNKYKYCGKYKFAQPCLTPNQGELCTLFIGNMCINTRDWPGKLNYREDPLIIHQLQPNLHCIQRLQGEYEVRIFRKIPPIQAEIQRRSHNAPQVKCS